MRLAVSDGLPGLRGLAGAGPFVFRFCEPLCRSRRWFEFCPARPTSKMHRVYWAFDPTGMSSRQGGSRVDFRLLSVQRNFVWLFRQIIDVLRRAF